jgi:hypothetical protein
MYGVIVCNKCRMHAQIIKVGTSRTVQCQRCGARLELRKLQLISTSENRDEVVKIRTLMQAKLQENVPVNPIHAAVLNCQISQKNTINGNVHSYMPDDGRNVRSRDPVKIILDNISDQDEMSLDELEEKCSVLGIERDLIEKVITRLLEAGDLYSPESGKVKKA